MRATGIVRRIDDLGRVVVPKEIRRSLRIKEGDPLEIFVQDGAVVYKKYSAMREVEETAASLCRAMRRATGETWAVVDRDEVIAAAGDERRSLIGKRISPELEATMETRRTYQSYGSNKPVPVCDMDGSQTVSVVAPILTDGELTGAVLYIGGDYNAGAKMATMGADFLGRYMEF